MKTVIIRNTYDVPAEQLWKAATNYGDLDKVAGSAVSFQGLPDGEFSQGQSISVTISLLGLLPRQDYHIAILERDDINRILRSSERGAGVNIWNHTMAVSDHADGSLLTDTVEVEAGWLTIPAALWAKYLYRSRHKPRLRVLASAAH